MQIFVKSFPDNNDSAGGSYESNSSCLYPNQWTITVSGGEIAQI